MMKFFSPLLAKTEGVLKILYLVVNITLTAFRVGARAKSLVIIGY